MGFGPRSGADFARFGGPGQRPWTDLKVAIGQLRSWSTSPPPRPLHPRRRARRRGPRVARERGGGDVEDEPRLARREQQRGRVQEVGVERAPVEPVGADARQAAERGERERERGRRADSEVICRPLTDGEGSGACRSVTRALRHVTVSPVRTLGLLWKGWSHARLRPHEPVLVLEADGVHKLRHRPTKGCLSTSNWPVRLGIKARGEDKAHRWSPTLSKYQCRQRTQEREARRSAGAKGKGRYRATQMRGICT